MAFGGTTVQNRWMDARAEPAHEKFEFSNTLQFDQEQYVQLNGLLRGKRYPLLRACCALAGIVMLAWSYTLLPGIIMLTILGLLVFSPQRLRGSAEWHYRTNPVYQQPITYVVSNDGLRFLSQGAEAEIVWAKTTVWEVRGDLLRITPPHFPNCWFQMSELEQAGVYEQVMNNCRRYGRQFKGK
ncbi:MAG: hypothetical protein AAGA00_13140 [Pseudomonadota bacterium]